MSTPGRQDDDPTQADPAAAQALPADAPEGGTAVHDVAGAGVPAPTTGPSDAVADQPAAPAKASADGPSGTGLGSPGGIPASITEKLPVDAEVLEQKPELLVAGAFVGGFLVAKVLRRIAGV